MSLSKSGLTKRGEIDYFIVFLIIALVAGFIGFGILMVTHGGLSGALAWLRDSIRFGFE